MIPGFSQRRHFNDLSEQEVLALAISSEEDDAGIYRWYAQRLHEDYPQSAQVFEEMAAEEDAHRTSLIEEHRRRFGPTIPPIRREHVAGFYHRRPVRLIENLGLERIRDEAARMSWSSEPLPHIGRENSGEDLLPASSVRGLGDGRECPAGVGRTTARSVHVHL